jgi:bifunctional N-acetylglucosamine-1-phosphate-uridyltransferase/glucosamine-1-phosphate-acetyltransferase GlmU-like protein
MLTAIVMAAGKGTRMKSERPKAITPLLGQPLTRYVLQALEAAGVAPIIVVVGHGADEVQHTLGEQYRYALQAEQLGTGHAVMQAVPYLPAEATHVLIAAGDSPLVTPEVFRALHETALQTDAACVLATAMCWMILQATGASCATQQAMSSASWKRRTPRPTRRRFARFALRSTASVWTRCATRCRA